MTLLILPKTAVNVFYNSEEYVRFFLINMTLLAIKITNICWTIILQWNLILQNTSKDVQNEGQNSILDRNNSIFSKMIHNFVKGDVFTGEPLLLNTLSIVIADLICRKSHLAEERKECLEEVKKRIEGLIGEEIKGGA